MPGRAGQAMDTELKRSQGAPNRDRIGAASVSPSNSVMTSGCPLRDSRGDSWGDLAMGDGRSELLRASLGGSALVQRLRRPRRASISCSVRSKSRVVGMHPGAFEFIIDGVLTRSAVVVRHLAVTNPRVVRDARSHVFPRRRCETVGVRCVCEERSVTTRRCVVLSETRADAPAVPRRGGGEPGRGEWLLFVRYRSLYSSARLGLKAAVGGA